MAVSLAELARLVAGDLVGPENLQVHEAATLSEARAGEITFLDSRDKAHLLANVQASAIVVPRNMDTGTLPAIQVDDVVAAFATIVAHFRPPRRQARLGISSQACVSPSARIGADVDLHPGCTIGDDVVIGSGCTLYTGVRLMAGCRLADNVTIYPNAVLYEETVVGPRVVIHAGAVLGAHGFGYREVQGRHVRGAQLGNVVIEADVEIGACTTIDRGTFGPTTIGEGTKIDNQVMIAHNCRIGRHNLICSQVGIAGSTVTGDYVMMGGQAGVRDHVHIGDRAVLAAACGVPNDVAAGEYVIGTPARPQREQKLIFAAIVKLPEWRKEFKALRAEVAELRTRTWVHASPAAADASAANEATRRAAG